VKTNPIKPNLKVLPQNIPCSAQNPVKYPVLAVGFAILVHVNSAFCLLYYLNCLWYVLQFRDFE